MKLAEATRLQSYLNPKSIEFKLPALRQGLGWGPRMVRFLMGPATPKERICRRPRGSKTSNIFPGASLVPCQVGIDQVMGT
jgi:hypothetical protein